VDERRLYEVGPQGGAWTSADAPNARQRRLARLRWLFAIGIGANAASWTLAGVALVIGGRLWGAGFGLLALATTPLLALPAILEALARLRARRLHRRRPGSFPAG
jgi:hypothetical protein